MKIRDKQKTIQSFSSICPGTVFEIDSEYYMKTFEVLDDGHDKYNAVKLRNGVFMMFTDIQEVTYVDCELVVK